VQQRRRELHGCGETSEAGVGRGESARGRAALHWHLDGTRMGFEVEAGKATRLVPDRNGAKLTHGKESGRTPVIYD
jgi:hypothetical protein